MRVSHGITDTRANDPRERSSFWPLRKPIKPGEQYDSPIVAMLQKQLIAIDDGIARLIQWEQRIESET